MHFDWIRGCSEEPSRAGLIGSSEIHLIAFPFSTHVDRITSSLPTSTASEKIRRIDHSHVRSSSTVLNDYFMRTVDVEFQGFSSSRPLSLSARTHRYRCITSGKRVFLPDGELICSIEKKFIFADLLRQSSSTLLA